MGFMPVIGRCYIHIYLDGTLNQSFPSTNNTVMNYTAVFENLVIGQHTIKMDVYALTFSQIGSYNSNVTQTVSFTIGSESQMISFYEKPVEIVRGPYPSPSPTPSPSTTAISSATPSPTATTNPNITPSNAPSQQQTSPSPSPTIPEFPTWVTVPLIVALALIVIQKRKVTKR
ncbi:MAG: hypothetical protein NWF00_11175 [Candidatus Bathyarchaeota archaeon]|nr:hypothetical protein [Candidatus Bathyarchaeota archaeon]